MRRRSSVFLFALTACGGKSAASVDAAPDVAPDVAIDAPIDPSGKAASCAATFGTSLTPAFGRLDGTVLAVVPPGDEACAEPNSTHLVVQVTMSGEAYRMVVDVLSDAGSPDVHFSELDAPLVGPAWGDGWHAGMTLDYVTTLAVHSTQLTAMHEADLVTKITSEIALGAHISIFATATSAEPDSAHLVHRNLTNADGAIVIAADSAPHYLLMAFDEQTF